MEVIVTKAQLDAHNACSAAVKSPEWDTEREALVYTDWERTVKRLCESTDGISYLSWLVARNLVPMTRLEFAALRKAARLNAHDTNKESTNG